MIFGDKCGKLEFIFSQHYFPIVLLVKKYPGYRKYLERIIILRVFLDLRPFQGRTSMQKVNNYTGCTLNNPLFIFDYLPGEIFKNFKKIKKFRKIFEKLSIWAKNKNSILRKSSWNRTTRCRIATRSSQWTRIKIFLERNQKNHLHQMLEPGLTGIRFVYPFIYPKKRTSTP